MHIVLTRKGDGKKIAVNPGHVKLFEPDSDGTSTHIVYGVNFVRVVTESFDYIMEALKKREVF